MRKLTLITFFLFALFLCCPSVHSSVENGFFYDVWLKHGIVKDGENGFEIHMKFKVNRPAGTKISVAVYFESPRGTDLRDFNKKYYAKNGNVAVFKDATVSTYGEVFDDFVIFMPISELHLIAGKHSVFFIPYVWDESATPSMKIFNSIYTEITVTIGGASNNDQHQTWPCNICGGTGRCIACATWSSDFMCPYCHNTRKCIICNGTGRLDYNPNAPIFQGVVPSTPSYNNNTPSGQGAKTRCTHCNGTGYIDHIEYATEYGTSYKWCDKCNKSVTSGHYHNPKKCTWCNGTGYR